MKEAIYLTFCLTKLSVEQRCSKWRVFLKKVLVKIFVLKQTILPIKTKKTTENIFPLLEITMNVLLIKKVFFQRESMRCG